MNFLKLATAKQSGGPVVAFSDRRGAIAPVVEEAAASHRGGPIGAGRDASGALFAPPWGALITQQVPFSAVFRSGF